MTPDRIRRTENSDQSQSYTIYRLEKSLFGQSLAEAPSQFDADYGINITRLPGLVEKIQVQNNPYIKDIIVQGPFINFKLDMVRYGGDVTSEILAKKDDYGKEDLGMGKRVIIDMSSPNIAKRMNYGHLRSTIIGDALANIYKFQGYEVIRDNHIGDWGTQFGKLITAIKLWGNEEELLASDDPIGILQDLYVKFHSVAEEQAEVIRDQMKAQVAENGLHSLPELEKAVDEVSQEIIDRKKIKRAELDIEKVTEDALDRVVVPEIEKSGREWFMKLEDGDPEAKRLWKICIDLSMKEFDQMYQILGVGFELTLGESFYENKLKEIIHEVEKSGVGKDSDGALVVELEGLGVSIIRKSNGGSVYMTRDLATAEDREQRLKADKVIYVVGEDQKHYFQQLFGILKALGHDIGNRCEHVYFGMVRLPEGKMSTRKGRTILLKDVIDEGLRKAEEIINTKNPELSKDKVRKDRIVRQIAIGALKWNDLSQDPKRPIEFHWEKALNFEGNGSPYVQYTAIRAGSILETAAGRGIDLSFKAKLSPEAYSHPLERALVRKLAEFPKVMINAQKSSNPSLVASYIYELARRFSSFYRDLPVLKGNSGEVLDARLRLVAATRQVISNGLGILGIEIPEKM